VIAAVEFYPENTSAVIWISRYPDRCTTNNNIKNVT